MKATWTQSTPRHSYLCTMKRRFRRSAAMSMRIAIYLTEVLPFPSRLTRLHRSSAHAGGIQKAVRALSA